MICLSRKMIYHSSLVTLYRVKVLGFQLWPWILICVCYGFFSSFPQRQLLNTGVRKACMKGAEVHFILANKLSTIIVIIKISCTKFILHNQLSKTFLFHIQPKDPVSVQDPKFYLLTSA